MARPQKEFVCRCKNDYYIKGRRFIERIAKIDERFLCNFYTEHAMWIVYINDGIRIHMTDEQFNYYFKVVGVNG